MRFPILSTWIATCMILLSTVVMHHHHYVSVCVGLEMFGHGPAQGIEQEPETEHSHQEPDCGSCRLHQLHSFIINSATQKSIRRHISDGRMFFCAAIPVCTLLPPSGAQTVVRWQHAAQPLPACLTGSILRRGPPVF